MRQSRVHFEEQSEAYKQRVVECEAAANSKTAQIQQLKKDNADLEDERIKLSIEIDGLRCSIEALKAQQGNAIREAVEEATRRFQLEHISKDEVASEMFFTQRSNLRFSRRWLKRWIAFAASIARKSRSALPRSKS